MKRRAFLIALATGPAAALAGSPKSIAARVYGKIQFVKSFPDYKVEVVSSFSDLKVEIVDSFPDKPGKWQICLLYTSPSPRDRTRSRMPSSA